MLEITRLMLGDCTTCTVMFWNGVFVDAINIFLMMVLLKRAYVAVRGSIMLFSAEHLLAFGSIL